MAQLNYISYRVTIKFTAEVNKWCIIFVHFKNSKCFIETWMKPVLLVLLSWFILLSSFQDPEILQPQSNEILTAIVHGMKKEEPRWVF